ncbi:RsmD family RNA methyltransferase [Candidatus Fermentibacterales bacterium]|nr:RsmD family RNA methyltransferase [Candidatus Fermentibacterales bacterium]
MTRIGRGTWKGHVLRPSFSCRPTTSMVRGAVMDIMGPLWAAEGDAVVWDLCCGAGGVGLEALSSGAGMAVFVDRRRCALDFVRSFLLHRGCADRAAFVRSDVRAAVDALPSPVDMIFIDPPYDSRDLREWALARDWSAVLSRGGRAFVEAPAGLGERTGWTLRRYGGSVLYTFRGE